MRGLMISDIVKQPDGREATFADPDGNGWVLQQPASFPRSPRPILSMYGRMLYLPRSGS